MQFFGAKGQKCLYCPERTTGQGWDARWDNHYFSVKIWDGTQDAGWDVGWDTGKDAEWDAGWDTRRDAGRDAQHYFFLYFPVIELLFLC